MASNQGNPPPPFTKFSDQYQALSSLLDKVKGAYSQGTAAVGSAYASTHNDGSKALGDVVAGLTATQIGYLAGVVGGFTNPGNTDPNDPKNNNQTDIVNAALTVFDAPASKYFKGQSNDGDNARPALQSYLSAFDTAIQVSGSMGGG